MFFKKKPKFFLYISIFFLMTGVQCTHFKNFLRPSAFKVGVIIPPGGARSLSAIGLFQALEEYNVSIDYLVGMGWGAWLAAAYAKSQSVDVVRWSVHKLKKKGYLGSRKNTGGSSFLNEVKESLVTSNPLIPFACPSVNKEGQVKWNEDTNLISSLNLCLPHPSFFKVKISSAFKKNNSVPLLVSIKEAIEFLKSKRMTQILLLDPLSGDPTLYSKGAFEELLWLELLRNIKDVKDSSVVKITPSLRAVGIRDFDQMIRIISAGKQASLPIVKKLQRSYKLFDF